MIVDKTKSGKENYRLKRRTRARQTLDICTYFSEEVKADGKWKSCLTDIYIYIMKGNMWVYGRREVTETPMEETVGQTTRSVDTTVDHAPGREDRNEFFV